MAVLCRSQWLNAVDISAYLDRCLVKVVGVYVKMNFSKPYMFFMSKRT